ncbi:MAG TPA: hypothetical protein VFU15_07055 [Bacteroidia bacterium]|nr:hypothetical protein [Bacteroidia bacterium]
MKIVKEKKLPLLPGTPVTALALLPGQQVLVSGQDSQDGEQPNVCCWDLRTKKLAASFFSESYTRVNAVSPGNGPLSVIFPASENVLAAGDLRSTTQTDFYSPVSCVRKLAWSEKIQQLLVSGDKTVCIDAAGKQLWSMPGDHERDPVYPTPPLIDWTGDNERTAFMGQGVRAGVYEGRQLLRPFEGAPEKIISLSCNDKLTGAISYPGNQLRFWNHDGSEYLPGVFAEKKVKSFAFGNGHLLLCGTIAGHVQGYDIRSGERLFSQEIHKRGAVSALACCDDLVISGGQDGTLWLYRIEE